MTQLAVDIFLSLDITRHNRELRSLTLAGNPDQARDEHGRWTDIESAMSAARDGVTKSLANGKPKGSYLKNPEQIHDVVRRASAVAAATGSVRDHKSAARAAKSAANKIEVLAADHSRVGNIAEAQSAMLAAKAYKNLAKYHTSAAAGGGDSVPHGALMSNSPVRRHMVSPAPQDKAKEAAVEPHPDIEYPARSDYGAMTEDEAMKLPLTNFDRYSKGYQSSMPYRGEEVAAALDKLGSKSDDARAAQKDFDVGKSIDIEHLINMHADALAGIKEVTELLKPYRGGVRWNRMNDDADYHETQLRQLEKKAGSPKSSRVPCPAGSPEMYCSR